MDKTSLLRNLKRFRKDERGIINLGNVFAPLGTLLGILVIVLVVAAVTGVFFEGSVDIADNLTNATTGSDAGNSIANAFGIIVPIVLVLALVGVIFSAISRQNGG